MESPREVRRKEAFGRHSHLSSRKDFTRAYAGGSKGFGKYFVLFHLSNGREQSRLGITATRKVGGAVVRNRLKRIVREIYRREPVPGGVDYVVNVRREAVTAPFDALRAELTRLLARASRPGAVPR